MKTVLLKSIPFSIPIKFLYERLGGKRRTKVSSRVRRQAKKALKEIYKHSSPRAVYRVVPCEYQEDSVRLSDDISFDSKKVSRVFRDCNKAVVFLITMGPKVDELIKKTLKESPDYGYILDTAASLAAESAVTHLYETISDKVNDDEDITRHYSPGYCDWSIKSQKDILKLLPFEKLDVTLNSNYSMTPRKSLSGVIGICPAESAEASGNACVYCTKENCEYRRL